MFTGETCEIWEDWSEKKWSQLHLRIAETKRRSASIKDCIESKVKQGVESLPGPSEIPVQRAEGNLEVSETQFSGVEEPRPK